MSPLTNQDLNFIVRRIPSMESAGTQWPKHLVVIPRENWPAGPPDRLPIEAMRSQDFLVQVFSAPPPAVVRLSINRTAMNGDRWADGISWDDLQRLKAEAGWGNSDAVEVFPPDDDVVNVANMRHLWVMEHRLPFAWRGR